MATIQEVNSAIMFGDFTNDQLDSILSAVKFKRHCLAQSVKQAVRVGSQVKFYSSRHRQQMSGTVEKVAIKYITVNTGTERWKVPANMLEAA